MDSLHPDIYIYLTAAKILNPIGITCALIVLLVLGCLACVDLKHVNRISIRLIVAIAFADIMNHSGELAAKHITPSASIGCSVLAGFRSFSRMFYVLTNAAISFHLYRAYVQLKQSSWIFELIIWGVIWAICLASMTLFYFLGIFSNTTNRMTCGPSGAYKPFNDTYEMVQVILSFATIVYSIYVMVTGRRSLIHWINTYANSHLRGEDNIKEFKMKRLKMAERAFLYPLAIIITQPGMIVKSIVSVCGLRFEKLYIVVGVGIGLSGILTGIAFALDPAVLSSIKIAKLQLISRYQDLSNSADGGDQGSQTGLRNNRVEQQLYIEEMKMYSYLFSS